MRLFLLLLFPLLELYGLVVLGSYISGLGVVAWVVGSAFLGAWIIKMEGQQGLFTFQNQLRSGQVPEDLLFNKLAVFLAGVLLLIPGVISDVVALFLLIPPTRSLCISLLSQWMRKRMSAGQGFSGNGSFFYYTHREAPGNKTTVMYDCVLQEDEPETEGKASDQPLTIDCTPEDTSKK